MRTEYIARVLVIFILLSGCATSQEVDFGRTEAFITLSPYTPVAHGDDSDVITQQNWTQSPATMTPTEVIEGTSTPSLSTCAKERIAFKVAGNNVKEGTYLACPDTGTIEFIVDINQYKADIAGLEDISKQNDAMLFEVSDYESPSRVISMDLASFTYTTILDLEANKNAYWVRWSPDKEFIGYLTAAHADEPRNPTIIEFLNVDKKVFSRIQPEASSIQYFDWSPTSQMILYLGGDGLHTPSTFLVNLICDDSTGLCEEANTHVVPNVGGEPSFSYDETSIISIRDGEEYPRGYIRITDLTGNIIHDIAVHELDPNVSLAYYPSSSHDGTQIAFVAESLDDGVENIYILDLRDMALLNLTGNTDREVSYGEPKW